MRSLKRIILILVTLGFSPVLVAFDDIKVMALSVAEGSAVIKTADNRMLVVKEGEALPGGNAKVTDVLVNRLVVEEHLDTEPPRLETIWIYKIDGGKSRVQRLGRVSPKAAMPILQDVRDAKVTMKTHSQ